MSKLILAAILGGVLGWAYAHTTIATECKKLGRFYVSKSVFNCTEAKT